MMLAWLRALHDAVEEPDPLAAAVIGGDELGLSPLVRAEPRIEMTASPPMTTPTLPNGGS